MKQLKVSYSHHFTPSTKRHELHTKTSGLGLRFLPQQVTVTLLEMVAETIN
jgi:hypothetical protein